MIFVVTGNETDFYGDVHKRSEAAKVARRARRAAKRPGGTGGMRPDRPFVSDTRARQAYRSAGLERNLYRTQW